MGTNQTHPFLMNNKGSLKISFFSFFRLNIQWTRMFPPNWDLTAKFIIFQIGPHKTWLQVFKIKYKTHFTHCTCVTKYFVVFILLCYRLCICHVNSKLFSDKNFHLFPRNFIYSWQTFDWKFLYNKYPVILRGCY